MSTGRFRYACSRGRGGWVSAGRAVEASATDGIITCHELYQRIMDTFKGVIAGVLVTEGVDAPHRERIRGGVHSAME
eukprot:808519-Alexandrium_andersonii.AAC.1